ncbi:unnamed protein product [Lota lota]
MYSYFAGRVSRVSSAGPNSQLGRQRQQPASPPSTRRASGTKGPTFSPRYARRHRTRCRKDVSSWLTLTYRGPSPLAAELALAFGAALGANVASEGLLTPTIELGCPVSGECIGAAGGTAQRSDVHPFLIPDDTAAQQASPPLCKDSVRELSPNEE